jgi:hypothetical protein
MFWTLAIVSLIALAGGGLSMGVHQVDEGIDAWEGAVKSVVKDREKKKDAVAFIETVRKDVAVKSAELGKAMAAYLEREADYNASPEELDSSLETFNEVWSEDETWLIDQRFALQEKLTPEAWQAALTRVDEKIGGHWDALKKAQKTAREKYEKRLKKLE